MENNANEQNGIFINGKAQIIEMLKFMTAKERATLLKNVRMRNPALAKELYAESITFETIYALDTVDLAQIIQFVKAPIMGVALKSAPAEFQRQLLGASPRAYAEEAYSYLTKNLGGNEERDIARAQKRVSDTIVALNNRGRISL
jgi:flagellar motor switch protein FliG